MKNAVKEHFDAFAPAYQKNFLKNKSGKTYEFSTRSTIIKNLALNSTGTLLECACGTGEITTIVLKNSTIKSAIIIDISNEMLSFAQKKIYEIDSNNNITFIQTDIFQYKPEHNQKFDTILCLGLIGHIGNLTKLLLHLKSILAPQGKIFLQSTLFNHWGTKTVKLITDFSYTRKKGYKLHYFKISDIKQSIHDSHMKILDIKRYCFGFPFGDKISKLGNYWLEILTQQFSSRFGSEAIFTITHNI